MTSSYQTMSNSAKDQAAASQMENDDEPDEWYAVAGLSMDFASLTAAGTRESSALDAQVWRMSKQERKCFVLIQNKMRMRL